MERGARPDHCRARARFAAALIVVLAAVLLAAGCGDDEGDPYPPPQGRSAGETQETEAPGPPERTVPDGASTVPDDPGGTPPADPRPAGEQGTRTKQNE